MTQRPTFDILDASIPEVHDYYRKQPDQIRMPSYVREYLADPVKWERHTPLDWELELEWGEYHYATIASPSQVDEQITSDAPGIYIFYIRPVNMIFGFPRLPLYVGISNERNSDRPLRERLKDYLISRAVALKKRGNVEQFLQLYYPVVFVAYALIPDRVSSELRDLESRLHGFVYPVYGTRDYPPDIKAQQLRKTW